jgi:hypothetical protein
MVWLIERLTSSPVDAPSHGKPGSAVPWMKVIGTPTTGRQLEAMLSFIVAPTLATPASSVLIVQAR